MTETAVEPTVVNPNEEQFAGYDDYWGSDEKQNFMLPDGKQYFTIQVMNEGQRARFQKSNNTDMKVDKESNATIKIDQAKERWALIEAAVVGWNLYKAGQPVAFSGGQLQGWLGHAPVAIVDDLEFAIRKFNPWLQNEMTIEQIDKEIANLKDLREAAEKREAGK